MLPVRYPTKTSPACFHSNIKTNFTQNVQLILPAQTVFGVALDLMSLLKVDGECAMNYVKIKGNLVLSLSVDIRSLINSCRNIHKVMNVSL